MATKKTQQNSDLSLDLPGSEADLDQAIDDLRGVLKQDADGDLSQFGGDLQSDPFAAGTDLAAFGGETSETPFGSDDFGGDFGGGDADPAAGMDFGSNPSFEASPAPLGKRFEFQLRPDHGHPDRRPDHARHQPHAGLRPDEPQ